MNVTDIESRIADYQGRHARGEITTLAHDIALIDAPALIAALTCAEQERDAFEENYTAVGARNKELHDQLIAVRADLHELRMRIEEADALARKDVDADGFVTAYHFNTGAWHRLLGEARKGDGYVREQ